MKCKEIYELLPDLAAGLSPVTAETDQHLRTCENCSSKLQEFRQTMALLDEWKAPEPSAYFDTRMQARFRGEGTPIRWLAAMVAPPCPWSFAGNHDGGGNFGVSRSAAADLR